MGGDVMAHGSVILGVVGLLGLAGFLYVFLTFFSKGGGLFIPGVRKCFWCEKKQEVVDVDFMAVNPKQYDVASCTAFSVEEPVSCDKHCVNALKGEVGLGTKGAPGMRERIRNQFRGFYANWGRETGTER